MNNNVTISADLAARFPAAFVVCVHAQNLGSQAVEAIAAETLESGYAEVRVRYAGCDDIASIAAIRTWREAYGQAGVKPSKYRSSIESLIRRTLRDDSLTILPLVDIYNGVSLHHGVPLGAVDDGLLEAGDIELRLCRPEADHFEPLGGDSRDFPLLATVPVYAIGTTILCWCFNCRDARPTALRRETERAIFFSEGIHSDQLAKATAAMEDLARILRSAGATTRVSVTRAK